MDETPKSCKVVLLGESGVGKTSIINQFTTSEFQEDQISTTGASFSSKTFSFEETGKNLSFEIWDTAGQEKYRSLSKMFYKDAGVAILVYDITSKESFDQIKNYWVIQLREYGPKNIIIAVAGNKSDLDNEQVDEESVRNYAKENNFLYKRTSAKIHSSIDDLFHDVGMKFLDPEFQQRDDVKEMNLRKNDVKTIEIKDNNDEDEGNKDGNGGKKKKKCC